ncbi:hypothetical protein NSIN_20427 [Nitrosotalea sinensis]|uniref:Uncharacterized protein n=1 Tax=Nitrosotalea sinensis TaxID=1499975 RepID=A0A2H1EGK4_9ARCH|nr:hypothetical protein [Candidatus Nitrosotalea sinensis]SHO44753.1 hypothetical protein NSIN_20427 [Candidatus Nitrosotalea sinensis]
MVNEVEWVYFETDTTNYYWQDKEISVTVYGTIRSGMDGPIDIILTGPIGDANPAHQPRSDRPVNAVLSRCEFPEVGCFKQVIRMQKSSWPYDGKYQLTAKYGGVESKPIWFYVDTNS